MKKPRNCCLQTHAMRSNDPTRTVTIRRRMEGAIVKRFRLLRRAIIEAIIKDKAFGELNESLNINRVSRGAFNFPRSDEKVNSFMRWLKTLERSGEINLVFPETLQPGAVNQAWLNTYIDSAYQQGIRRARQEMNKQGVLFEENAFEDSAVRASFNNPIHADRLGLIYTRVYSDLTGITEQMDRQISRVLAQGIADGRNPREIARLLVDRVDKIGITRARTLARTEVIRAHHSANIQEYRNAGIEEVRLVAEWVTAGDDRVCPLCEPLNGKLFEINAIENLIPRHPNCRCVAVPVLREDKGNRKIKRGL